MFSLGLTFVTEKNQAYIHIFQKFLKVLLKMTVSSRLVPSVNLLRILYVLSSGSPSPLLYMVSKKSGRSITEAVPQHFYRSSI